MRRALERDEEAKWGKTGASPLRDVRIFSHLADEVAAQRPQQGGYFLGG